MRSRKPLLLNVVLIAVLVLPFICPAPAAWGGERKPRKEKTGLSQADPSVSVSAEVAPEDIYTARTADGVDLALRRYRPDSESPLREGAQPVILVAGLACNFEFYDAHTPEGVVFDEKLPEDLAPWAEGDPHIQADPMKYYSMAYYLWKMGYDPWLANYRGQGRGEFRSGGASGYAIDELGIYDMPAIISRVRELTGIKPVWVGHSMGGVMSYIYLEGARFENMADPNSHVVSDPALVAERNDGNGPQALKGLVSLDGPNVPGGEVPCWLRPLLWTILYVPFYLDIRPITANLGGLAADPALALETLMRRIWGDYDYGDLGLANFLLSIDPENLDGNLSRFFFTYAADGASTRTIMQFFDAVVHRRMREDYRNGFFNFWRWAPPAPRQGDGYYYYSDHLDRISLPALIIVDATPDITNPEDVRFIYDNKTRNAKDGCHVIPRTAHADIVLGLNAPTELFPKIGEWLESL